MTEPYPIKSKFKEIIDEVENKLEKNYKPTSCSYYDYMKIFTNKDFLKKYFLVYGYKKLENLTYELAIMSAGENNINKAYDLYQIFVEHKNHIYVENLAKNKYE